MIAYVPEDSGQALIADSHGACSSSSFSLINGGRAVSNKLLLGGKQVC